MGRISSRRMHWPIVSSFMQQFQSALGIFALLGLAFVISEDRRAVAWRQAGGGLAVTIVATVIILKAPGSARAIAAVKFAGVVGATQSTAHTSFCFWTICRC